MERGSSRYRNTDSQVIRTEAVLRTGFLGWKKKRVEVELKNGGFITAQGKGEEVLFEKSISDHKVTEKGDMINLSLGSGRSLSFSGMNREQFERLSGSLKASSRLKLSDHYQIGELIGKGAYAKVYLGKDIDNNEDVAIKVMTKGGREAIAINDAIDREVEILRRVEHPSIVTVLDVFETEYTAKIILEYMESGSVFDLIRAQKNGRLKEDMARYIFRQVLEGIEYLHGEDIVHSDIKAENVLLKGQYPSLTAKLADFGLSFKLPKGETKAVNAKTAKGTPEYFAPELVRNQSYDHSVDIWACGVLLYVMLGGTYPHHGDTQEKTKELVRQNAAKIVFPATHFVSVSKDAQGFIRKMMTEDRSKRPTATQCLQDSWIIDTGRHGLRINVFKNMMSGGSQA
mmetsp:Transcript_1499/g.2482  ORF Transcript_1499/g.2482 Transcript_1499/m.2482 type:complete len:400 (+) Transcript_1499:384-1583(+)